MNPSPFAALIERPPRPRAWPATARRTHRIVTPKDREYTGTPVGEYEAGKAGKVRTRANRIAQIIRERGTVDGRELAKAVGVAARTIGRDIQLLKEAGAPIDGCPHHGYRWVENPGQEAT